MLVERLEVGVFAENCYVVGCEATREGVIIDPGDEAPRIIARVRELGLVIQYVLLTHAHLDHVQAVPEVKAEFEVPVLMHRQDQFLLDNLPAQAAAFGLTVPAIPEVDRYLEEGDTVSFGQITFEVLHTPGHSPGSITFYTPGTAFVGDVLFCGSIGRTDLPGGDYNTLMDSIRSKLLPLGDDTTVLSGHGPETRIGTERASNPFLVETPM